MSTSTTGSARQAPTAEWVDPTEMNADPYESYDRLRMAAPVVWVPQMNRYLATGFEACRLIEADQATFSAGGERSSATMARALGGVPMLRKDDPEHAAERQPINSPMRPRQIRDAWVPLFEANAKT